MGKTDVWQGTLALMILQRLARESAEWEQTTAIPARFFAPPQES